METLPRTAWEPITPRGVAAFARATVGRLLLVQFIVALMAVTAGVWFLYHSCFPTIREAIRQMPATGEIRSRELDWRGDSPRLLAEGRFLAFSVDMNRAGDLRSPAHLQLEFRRDGILFRSLFGYLETAYPDGWVIAFNRTELQPWWGAWQPWLLAIAALGALVYLLLSWSALATLYALPVWLMALYTNRDLDLWASWKLAGAALMPGALLMAGAILFYDLAWLDLTHLLFVFGAHLVLGWIYAASSQLFLPRHPATATRRRNPFARPPKENPFAPPPAS
jgi:hypothetical protein